MQTLYVALKEQVTVIAVQHVKIQDIAELDGDPALVKRARDLILSEIQHTHPHSFRLDILDLTRILRRFCPNAEVNNVGATEVLVHYRPTKPQRKPVLEFLKVCFIGAILFWGAAVSLMSFQNEASLPEIFSNIHYLCTGEVTQRPTLLLISYTIGIAVGIILFFNHWAGIKIKEDPTPVEVEYVSYKKEIESCMLDMLKNQDDFGQKEHRSSGQ